MSLKALADNVIERGRLAGQKRGIVLKTAPPPTTRLGQSAPPYSPAGPDPSEASKAEAADWRRGVTPSSRRPLIPDVVRSIIEGIEPDARAHGWPAELLWNAEFWGSPRGLAAVLDESDAVGKVTSDFIEILKTERSILRFQRYVMNSTDTVSTASTGRT
jgi:hypothetical protein